MDHRAKIGRFLAQNAVFPLPSAHALLLPQQQYNKAGIIPFIRGSHKLSYYMMKPHARHADLPPPEFQICKGTRMQQLPDETWQDVRTGPMGENPEALAVTALREGIEEIGLIPANIATLYDIGGFDFSSAATGKTRCMWLFAAGMKSATDFIRPDNSTADCRWLTLDEFAVAGRKDHHYILSLIDALLKEPSHSPR